MDQPSPCTGICRLDREQRFCLGCFRRVEEIVEWGRASYETRTMIWKQLGERREHHGEALLSRDQLGRDVLIPSPVRRIVSLVPSITQTLYDLGCEDRVVGITGFAQEARDLNGWLAAQRTSA